MGLQNGMPAVDAGYQNVQILRKKITYLVENTVIDIGTIPAYATVVGGGVHVVTAFADSGTDTLDVGFRAGSSTDDPNGLATLLDISTVGFKALDELAATTNIMQTKDTIITVTYNGANNDAAAGEAYVIIMFVAP